MPLQDLNRYDIQLEQGASWFLDLDFPLVDLTGYVGKAQIRRQGTLLAEILVGILNPAKGKVRCSLTAEQTAAIDLRGGVADYDLLLISSGGVVEKKLRGKVRVNRTVTQL